MDKQTVMITFRTEVGLPKVKAQLSYRHNAVMIGSCFTENIGNYLKSHYFPILINPCGILYNPASMADCIAFMVKNKSFDESELFYDNGLWNHFSFHSRFSHPDKVTALAKINDSITLATSKLRLASHLFLTFGTSWIYREKELGAIVGNCHKLPANRFLRERLSVDEMTLRWVELLEQLFAKHPLLNIVLTVSPIRHLKDGSYENQVSKSGLFLLVDHLISTFGTERVTYFPSYELVMDELRDYRFYATDMLHLSELATSFVQDKFNEVFLDRESMEIKSAVSKIVKSLSHKPFQVESSSYRDMLIRLHDEVLSIASIYPFVDFEELIIEIIQNKGD
jgi:hypothetical protein